MPTSRPRNVFQKESADLKMMTEPCSEILKVCTAIHNRGQPMKLLTAYLPLPLHCHPALDMLDHTVQVEEQPEKKPKPIAKLFSHLGPTQNYQLFE
jgi:hypothetical protein